MSCAQSKRERVSRLRQYSIAAGLGAFAFGQAAAEGTVVYTDCGPAGQNNGLVINRGESYLIDANGDGLNDFRLVNTLLGGIGGYGSVQLNSSADVAWYGTNNPATGYARVLTWRTWFDPGFYYIKSFIDNEIIGPGNPNCGDETGTSGGRLYGLVSQYPGWNKNSFWNPGFSPWAELGYGYEYNEYAGLKVVDTNGETHYGWVRFQVILHDAASTNGFPIPDGKLTKEDLRWDTNREVILYDFAYETTPDTDIVAGLPPECMVGDPNCDGIVDIEDLNFILSNWNQTPPTDPRADLNGDGTVDIEDLGLVLGNWNVAAPPSSEAVPEPGCLGLLAAGAGALALRRQRSVI